MVSCYSRVTPSFTVLLPDKSRVLLHRRRDEASQRRPPVRRRQRRTGYRRLRFRLIFHSPVLVDIHRLILLPPLLLLFGHGVQPREADAETFDLALDEALLLLEGAGPALEALVADFPLAHLPQALLGLAVGQQVGKGRG